MKEKQLQIVTFEQARRLKKLDFDWECAQCYGLNAPDAGVYKELFTEQESLNYNDTEQFPMMTIALFGYSLSAPTVALAFKWIRDEKKLFGYTGNAVKGIFGYSFYNRHEVIESEIEYNTYEAAESALLDELLTILEKDVER
jgi:hypothetical protein